MIELHVEGMTCGHCVSAVTRAVQSVDPRADVRVDLATGAVRVEGSGSAEVLRRAICASGFSASAAGAGGAEQARRSGGCCHA